MVHSAWAAVSTRTPGPPGMLKAWIVPGDGTKRPGSSALIRHSMACPVNVTSLCLNDSRSPAAIADLLLDQVDAGDHLGDRMFDLDAGVDLDEVEVDCPRPRGTRTCRRSCSSTARAASHDRRAHLPAHLVGTAIGGRFLDQLLMPPLERAVALAEMDRRCRDGRRGPGPRRAAAARDTSRGRRRRPRTPPRPRAGPCWKACAQLRRVSARRACRGRRRRRPP